MALKAELFDGIMANVADALEVHDSPPHHLSGNIHRKLKDGSYRSNDPDDALYIANVVLRVRDAYRSRRTDSTR